METSYGGIGLSFALELNTLIPSLDACPPGSTSPYWSKHGWAVDYLFGREQAVYSKTHAMVLMYGGQGYSDWQTPSVNVTTETSVLSDFWWVRMS